MTSTIPANASFLTRALPLLKRGFSVIPLTPGQKHPCGIGALSRTKEIAIVRQWAERIPDANVAIVADDDICILESDDVERLSELIKSTTSRELPTTLTACGSSEKRPHFFFKHTAKSRNVGCMAVPGLFECRFSNQYVVGPGSIHPDGHVYRFLNDAPIAEIPDWLVSELTRLAIKQKQERRNQTSERDGNGKFCEGGRHYALFSELGRKWTGEQTEEELLEWARAWNDFNCEPTMEDWRVRNDVRDIMKRKAFDPGPKVVIGEVRVKEVNGNVDPNSWCNLFHTFDETMNAPPLKFAIEGFLQQDGITLIGGLAGHGKTLLMLNMAKALLEGGSLFGYEPFTVNGTANRVVYLVPESGLGPFVHRLKLFGLHHFVETGKFFFRTLSAKEHVALDDPRIMKAVEGADVFLDTAVRFMPGDENSAADQRAFAQTLFDLQKAGARTITGAHHAPKNYERLESMTLENTLRGSGDIGAMLATCWAVKQVDKTTNRLHIANVKPRDFEPCEPFQIEGRPWIDQTGHFKMVAVPGMAVAPKPAAAVERLNKKAGMQAEARHMRASGYSHADIAKHLNVTVRTVERWQASGLLDADKPDTGQTGQK